MDAATFLTRYPEFTTTDTGLLNAVLAEAALSVDTSVYSLKADAVQGALAAHLLWTGAAGNSMRLSGDADPNSKANSLYWRQYLRLQNEVAVGFLVL